MLEALKNMKSVKSGEINRITVEFSKIEGEKLSELYLTYSECKSYRRILTGLWSRPKNHPTPESKNL